MSKVLNTAVPFFQDSNAHLNKEYGDVRIYSPKNFVLPFQVKTALASAGTVDVFELLEYDLRGFLTGNTYSLASKIAELNTGIFESSWYVICEGIITPGAIPYSCFVVRLTIGSLVYYSELVSKFDYEYVTPPA